MIIMGKVPHIDELYFSELVFSGIGVGVSNYEVIFRMVENVLESTKHWGE